MKSFSKFLKDVVILIVLAVITIVLVIGVFSEFSWLKVTAESNQEEVQSEAARSSQQSDSPVLSNQTLQAADSLANTEIEIDAFPEVTAFAPLRLIIPYISINQEIVEYTNEMMIQNNNTISPNGYHEIVWWSGGGRPGADDDNIDIIEGNINFTTFLYGHSSNQTRNPAIFNNIGTLEAGDEICIEAESATFVYEVQLSFVVHKSELMSHPEALKDEVGRLLLISCNLDGQLRNDGAAVNNIVVVATLVSISI